VLAVIAVLAALAVHSSAARADGPGSGSPWVASVGDSYISGEAGRWAGNSNAGSGGIDALGSTAYYDNGSNSGEAISGCHRSKSAEVFIGGGVNGVNLACSGAKTATSDGSDFKPGLDFYSNGTKQGQALALQGFAASHNVKMISLSIGGNNFNFASVVQSCVQDWLLSPSWWKDYCNDDSSVTANFTAANVAAQTAAIKGAILNIRQAMTNAGYSDAGYQIVVQDYESPLPPGAQIRYGESGYTRQNTGGCGFWNNDANWANSTALPTINNAVRNAAAQTGLSNVKLLELQSAFNGHRLCENTVGLLRRRASPPGPRPAPSTRASGSTRSAPSPPSSARTTCRSRSTPTTGVSWRCATARARPTTAARPAGAPARSPAPGSRRRASPTWRSTSSSTTNVRAARDARPGRASNRDLLGSGVPARRRSGCDTLQIRAFLDAAGSSHHGR